MRLFPLQIIDHKTKIDFMGHRLIGFAVTGLLVILSIYSLSTKGLNFGIDFTGGVVMEIRTEQPADIAKLREILSRPELGEASLQNFEDPRDVMIRIRATGDDNQGKVAAEVKELLNTGYGSPIEYRKVDYVGPTIGKELVTNSLLAMGLALLAIQVYLWFRFEWQYGVGGILALAHDAFLTVGFYSVSQIEFNMTSIAALLTIVGYSINDSVVIYDRIREIMRKYKTMPISEVLNLSMNETLSRTIYTVCTVILALLGLYFYGGEVLHGFSAGMLFGVFIGTFSSIYIASTSLIYLNLRNDKSALQPA